MLAQKYNWGMEGYVALFNGLFIFHFVFLFFIYWAPDAVFPWEYATSG